MRNERRGLLLLFFLSKRDREEHRAAEWNMTRERETKLGQRRLTPACPFSESSSVLVSTSVTEGVIAAGTEAALDLHTRPHGPNRSQHGSNGINRDISKQSFGFFCIMEPLHTGHHVMSLNTLANQNQFRKTTREREIKSFSADFVIF